MSKRVLVPIADGTEELEAVAVIDIMRRGGIEVIVAGISESITCSRGVVIKSDCKLSEIDEQELFDAIVIPGGAIGTENLASDGHLKQLIVKHRQNKRILGAICAAPAILTKHEAVPVGNRITSHPSVKKYFSDYNFSEDIVVIDNGIVTSRGAGTSIEFGLRLVELLVSRSASEEVAKGMVFEGSW